MVGFVPSSEDHVGPVLSFLLVWGASLIPLVGILATAVSRARADRRLALEADQARDLSRVARPGPAVVRGRVVHDRGSDVAVRVEIKQTGSEWQVKGSWRHRWTELSRQVHTHGFFLELASGQRLAVEPDADVFLVDALSRNEDLPHQCRTRIAELTPGEEVWAIGQLYQETDPDGAFTGYREPPTPRLVLRAPRGKRLLLSSEPLGARHWARVRFHLRWLGYALVALGVLHGLLYLPYHLRTFRGVRYEARVTGKRSWVTGSGKNRKVHRVVDLAPLADYDWQTPFREDVSRETFLRAEPGDVLPVREAPGGVRNLGYRPTVDGFAGFFGGGFAVWLFFFYRWRREQSRPWWDRKLVDEGTGRLPSKFL